MINTIPIIRQFKLSNLCPHPDIPFDVLTAVGSITYCDSYKSIFSTSGIQFLLASHPPHAIVNSKGIGECFAGLRILQLAKTFLSVDTKISILTHTNVLPEMISEISTADIFLTTLAYGLDNKSWHFDIMKIWNEFGKDSRELYTPNLTTKKKLAKHIKTNHRLLSPKEILVESGLKGLRDRQTKSTDEET